MQLTIVSASHLPKMDIFGTCDPFVEVEFEGCSEKTGVMKGTYDATFDSALVFDVADCAAPVGEMSIKVLDWDLASAADEIGKVVLPGELMSRILKCEVGWEGEAKLDVRAGDKIVVGRDKKRCVVTIKALLMEGVKGLDPPEPSGEVKGARRVQLFAISVSHLPSMDLMGKCDPFVRAFFESEVHETGVVKSTYDATFEESFVLDVLAHDDDADAAVPDLRLQVASLTNSQL